MEQYIGLDVSLKETHICVVDGRGAVLARGREATQPDLLARAIECLAPGARLAVLETGGQSSWLHSELTARGVPAVIVDARRAKVVLSCRLNKTDANDAEGLAHLARTNWHHEVAAKRPETRVARSLLLARQQLVKQRRDLENQTRGLLRGFGLAVGTVARIRFEARVWELVAREPALEDTIDPLMMVRRSLSPQIKQLESRITAWAGGSAVCRRLMTVPGVGPMTALAFYTAIDDPYRFAKSSSVGAYLGLTPRGHQSGAVDWSGRITAWAGGSAVCRRLMTVPGVGPMTALAFYTAIDDPYRFAKSSSVGAYLGLTPRGHQSGAVDWSGRISKHGDALARHMLYEAANSLLSRVRKWSAPKAWAARLVKRTGGKKARVALARKLAVILHRIWADGTEFRWSNEAAV